MGKTNWQTKMSYGVAAAATAYFLSQKPWERKEEKKTEDSFPQTPTITCSAGGKVLLTGAYLVLSEVYSGLVMAVDARIYTSCSLLSSLPEDLSTSSLGSFNEEKRKEWRVVFEIVSEQLGFVSRYVVVFGTGEEGPFVALHPLNPQEHNPNPYFESAILFSCSSLFALLIKEKEGEVEEAGEELFGRLGGGKGLGVRLVVRADNHFYSQHRNLKERGKELRSEAFDSLPKFLPASRNEEGSIEKTGLGSSAALTVSFVASLVSFVNHLQQPPQEEEGKRGEQPPLEVTQFIHNLSQLAHCFAQGKIGSGFDVSSAVFGSQTYHRFPVALLQSIIASSSISYTPPSPSSPAESVCVLPSPHDILRCLGTDAPATSSTTSSSITSQCPSSLSLSLSTAPCSSTPLSSWPSPPTRFTPPPGFALLLADIRGGSNTPSMVRKVLEWKKNKEEEANKLWQDLDDNNNSVGDGFEKLSSLYEADSKNYEECLKSWANSDKKEANEVHKVLDSIHHHFQQVRKLLKTMGDNSGVPIEPDQQTRLIDSTVLLPGVVMSGVPGAGGYDSLFCLVRDTPEDIKQVEDVWTSWNEFQVLPVVVKPDTFGVVWSKQ